ncbi:MFS transporter [Paenibacillus crassostreae]|uniref:Fosmidomycin resistance protein n=1 Tax=Paenibacillus crassostreae TaxID=1763538 RepID=A0A167DUX7_9BACL|nr:MFS transporter [Paenibacillus crassostreae]AOZ91031.1 MFS transporter [Paenibacillus crassostreae]OAB74807.1 Fosmidomycin resistance protein [Paenibacillus crassostreae]
MTGSKTQSSASASAATTVYPILFAISIVHLLNDTMQSTVSALFPILKDSMNLSFSQIGLIAFAMNITASLLQPLIGMYADVRPRPYILPFGVCFTLIGIITLAIAPSFAVVLFAVISIGIGSAIFHPESSRVAYLASGGKRGFSQSLFQVGGNIGSSLGPIMTALIFVKIGQFGVIWFTIAALTAIAIQFKVAQWYGKQTLHVTPTKKKAAANVRHTGLSRAQVIGTIVILVFLVFSKNVYMSSITSFYTFFLIETHGVTIQHAQYFLFAFLGAAALGTFLGGPLSDRYGRRNIIWLSILGTAPFSILMPHVSLAWAAVLSIFAGFILSSAFSIIVVYAQELVPGKIGLISGLFFGLAFGLGGLGSAVMGNIADHTSIPFIMNLSSYLPLLGMLAILLPKDKELIR